MWFDTAWCQRSDVLVSYGSSCYIVLPPGWNNSSPTWTCRATVCTAPATRCRSVLSEPAPPILDGLGVVPRGRLRHQRAQCERGVGRLAVDALTAAVILHPVRNHEASASGSSAQSPQGRRRCRGRHPCCLFCPPSASLEGGAPAPSASAVAGSWPWETPPGGNTSALSLCLIGLIRLKNWRSLLMFLSYV